MFWKIWIASGILIILFKLALLESKLANDKNSEETKEDTYELPEEIRNMSFNERVDYWINEQGEKYEELNKLHEELHELELQIHKQKQDMFSRKW